jgi:hypothetical protein
MTPLILVPLLLAGTPQADSTTMEGCPHASGVDQRGDKAMGFDHEKTAHHFGLTADGGTISADAVDTADVTSRDAIRRHMTHIAGAFSNGDFAMPMFIHDRTPPGVPTMKRLHAHITYTVEDTDRGARVVIRTSDPAALKAVYAFLRFQISDHRTGDSPEPQLP